MIAGNPFATRFTRPGQLPAVDASGRPIDVDRVLARAGRSGFSVIIGPHGSGKSTLLVHLVAALRARGGVVHAVRLRSLCDLPALVWALTRAGPGATVAVDSWERLGVVGGYLLRGVAWCIGCRLIATTHQPGGCPVLADCRPTSAVLESLVARLPGADGWYGTAIDEQHLHDAFARHSGDIREALFDLYDRFEDHRRAARVVRI